MPDRRGCQHRPDESARFPRARCHGHRARPRLAHRRAYADRVEPHRTPTRAESAKLGKRVMSFKTEQIARLAESGWSRCESVAEAVASAGLPAVTPEYLAAAFCDDLWDTAERAVLDLRDHFTSARFADETTYGILLVPDPGKLDTRRPMAGGIRRDQLGAPTDD